MTLLANKGLSNKYCVYKITNLVNKKVYIGKTNNLKKRWKVHCNIAFDKNGIYSNKYYIHKSINKYGQENFKIEILENNLFENEAFERESFWIKKYNSRNPKLGMNMTDGGEGTSGLKWSDESRKKISGPGNCNFGKILSDDVKKKISISLSGENNGFFGKKHTPEVIEFLKNRPISDEQKRKNSEMNRGENNVHSKFTDKKILEIRSKWDSGAYSQTDIAREYNVKPNTINQIVRRKRWTHI